MVSKSTSILLAVAIVAVGAVAIIGLGYAYTASTESAGNSSTASYVTLSQDNYSWGSTALAYDTSTKVVNSKINFEYTLSGAIAIPGQSNTYGVKIGQSDLFSATVVGNVTGNYFPVTAAMVDTSKFDQRWKYVVEFDHPSDPNNGDKQYITFAYSNSEWSVTHSGYDGSAAKSDAIYMQKDKVYTVSLYVGITISSGDATVIAAESDTSTQDANDYKVTITNIITKDANAGIQTDSNKPTDLINGGAIKFTATFSTS